MGADRSRLLGVLAAVVALLVIGRSSLGWVARMLLPAPGESAVAVRTPAALQAGSRRPGQTRALTVLAAVKLPGHREDPMAPAGWMKVHGKSGTAAVGAAAPAGRLLLPPPPPVLTLQPSPAPVPTPGRQRPAGQQNGAEYGESRTPPSAAGVPGGNAPAASAAAEPVLLAVVHGPEGPHALLSVGGSIVLAGAGDRVGDWAVEQINQGAAVLRLGARTVTVRLQEAQKATGQETGRGSGSPAGR